MFRYFLFVVPLAALILLAGCDENNQGYASSGRSSSQPKASVAASPAAPASAAAPAQAQAAPASSRFSTTQPLPNGYGYIHEQDLMGGRITSAGASTQPYIVTQPQQVPVKGS